jgi:hypothetical protein
VKNKASGTQEGENRVNDGGKRSGGFQQENRLIAFAVGLQYFFEEIITRLAPASTK